MTPNGWLQILLFFAIIVLVAKPMGVFMAKVFSRERTFLDPVMRPVEKLLYKLTRVDENHEMRWTEYSIAMLSVQRRLHAGALLDGTRATSASVQSAEASRVPADLAWNTAAIHHQHQLQFYSRRADHELSDTWPVWRFMPDQPAPLLASAD